VLSHVPVTRCANSGRSVFFNQNVSSTSPILSNKAMIHDASSLSSTPSSLEKPARALHARSYDFSMHSIQESVGIEPAHQFFPTSLRLLFDSASPPPGIISAFNLHMDSDFLAIRYEPGRARRLPATGGAYISVF